MSISLNKKTKQKFVSVFVSMTTALWLSGAAALVPTAAYALTAAELQTQIDTLLAQIAQLQTQLATLQATTAPSGMTFAKDLKLGDTGADVKNLQIALNSDADTRVAVSGVGSSGNETTYFGSLTKAAVIKFQNKYASEVLTPIGLTAGTGYVGSMTRAKLNALYGVVAVTPTTPTTVTPVTTVTPAAAGTLKVEAGVQPAASLAPDLGARIPFTVVKFTAPADQDITVDSLTVERTGLANDAVFSGIILLDEKEIQLGLEKTLNSLHQAVLTEDFVVSKGTSRTMTIAANRADTSTYAGQIAYLSLVAVSAGTATIEGALPISGAGHTINESLTIGTVTMTRGALDPGANQTSKEIGTTGYTFSSVKVTAGSQEKVRLQSIRWYQSGSAAKSDLENVKTYVDGTAYDVVVSADGKYYTSTFDSGFLIDKGFSKELSIKGDIIGGSARTIDFDVFKRTDLYLKGETYKYGITPPNGDTTTGSDDGNFHQSTEPWYDAFQVTVSSGTITVSTSSAVPAQNVAINLVNQPLGAFTANVKGESISVSAMAFNVTIGNLTASSETAADITNVSMYDENGAVVAGPVDGTATESNNNGATGASHGEIRFSDTVIFPAGLHTYSLKGKLGTNFDTNDTVTASTTPRNFGTATGMTTGNTITVNPNSVLTLSQMTIKAGALAISVSTDPAAQTVISNASQFIFAKYILDSTASGEDIRVTSLPVEYNVGAGSATDLTNCKFYDGTTVVTTGSNVVNPSAVASSTTFTFDGSGLTITKGTSKIITLKCDVIGGATGNYYWGIDGALDDTASTYTGATGLTSGQTIVETVTDSVGQLMSAAAQGTLVVTKDTASPGYKIVRGGAANVELVRIRFSAANEDVDLKRMALQLTDVASNSPSNLVDGTVTLWDGATQVGSAVFSTSDFATSSLMSNFRVPRNGAKVLTVKGSLAAVSSDAVVPRSGNLLKVDYDGNSTGLSNGTYGTGVSSGNNVTPTGSDTDSSGVRIMKAYPTLTKLSVPTNALIVGSESGKSLYRFSITANSGDIAVYKWSFVIGSSSVQATTSTYGLYAYTNSGFSSIDSAFTSDGLVNYGNCVNGRNDVTNTTRVPDPNNSPLTIEIYPDKGTTACNATTTYVIAADTTRYFVLTGTVANVESVTGVETLSARLDGDAAYPVNQSSTYGPMDLASGVDGDTNDDFIWSPISTTTANSRFDVDFTNGYLVDGLPTTYMSVEYFTSPN